MMLEILPLTEEDFLLVLKGSKNSLLNATEKEISKLLKIFPQGQYCSKGESGLESLCLTTLIDNSVLKSIRKFPIPIDASLHSKAGDTLLEILMVAPETASARLLRKHRDNLKLLCETDNHRSLVVLAEIPGYSNFAPQTSLKDYFERVTAQQVYDPVLSYQLRGFVPRRVVRPYTEENPVVVLLEWNNILFLPEE